MESNENKFGLLEKMPVLFVGHGSPMNAIEDNMYSMNWEKVASKIPKPKAILSISAHWYTNGTRITDAKHPKMVYDMYGFPDELYQIVYKSDGAPELAHLTEKLISRDIKIDNSWGYDHGTWSILNRMYPEADIPVYQLSVDSTADAEVCFQIGKQISSLREKGVLILASGNVVHNLSAINWDMDGGYDWAEEFDNYIKDKIVSRQFQDIINYRNAGKSASLAVPTPDHFYPLVYILGTLTDNDKVEIFNDSCELGSLSMTSYLFY